MRPRKLINTFTNRIGEGTKPSKTLIRCEYRSLQKNMERDKIELSWKQKQMFGRIMNSTRVFRQNDPLPIDIFQIYPIQKATCLKSSIMFEETKKWEIKLTSVSVSLELFQ